MCPSSSCADQFAEGSGLSVVECLSFHSLACGIGFGGATAFLRALSLDGQCFRSSCDVL